MQPLLLLKQTIESGYDPGPLRLSGPNVDITAIEQVLSRPTEGKPQDPWFTAGITVDGKEWRWQFGRGPDRNLQIQELSGWFFAEQQRPLSIHERMTSRELASLATRDSPGLREAVRQRSLGHSLTVVRERCLLLLAHRPERRPRELVFDLAPHDVDLEDALTGVIHLPALRGNPRRTYQTVAVDDRYPGTFETYTAGVVAAWQQRRKHGRLSQLRTDLAELGLTSAVEARQLDDTQVELMVGRLPHDPEDLVNIADVGFGVSQTLPVVVALLTARPGQLVYLEQPEIHLHPRAQSAFAQLLRRAAARGVRVVVETHSALLIRGVQTLVARQQLDPVRVALHWFTRDPYSGYTQITSGELDRAGAFGDWPEDFDEVYLESADGLPPGRDDR